MTGTMTGTMTGLPLPAPFLEGLRDAMERLGDGPLAPALDLYTTPEAIIAKVALPGVKPENVDIKLDEDLVTISGSMKDEKETREARYIYKELSHGSFMRSFWLRSAVKAEAATASFKDGMLTLTLPKTQAVEPKQVKVEVV